MSFGKHGCGQVEFKEPQGVAVVQDGRIVVADHANHPCSKYCPTSLPLSLPPQRQPGESIRAA